MEPVNPLLPALRADTPGLLRRAGSLIGAVHGIQQEASAEYWFEQGVKHKELSDWLQARFCFDKAVALDDWHSSSWLFNAFVNCQLKQEVRTNECLVNAHLRGVLKPEAWFTSELNESDFKFGRWPKAG